MPQQIEFELRVSKPTGHKIYGTCSACGRCIGAIDHAAGDGLCGLCRIDAAKRVAAVADHCRRHSHSGVSPGYHLACRDVLRIIDGLANQVDIAE